MPGDSLLAADGPRLSVFDRTGRYVRGSVLESPAPDALATPSVAGVLASGGLMATLAVRTSSSDDGYFRPWFAHALLDPFDGRLLETLGTFPGAEIARRSGGGVEVSGELVITTGYASTPVSRRTVVTTAGDRVVIGEQGRFELFQFDANGALRMIVRIAEPPRPLDSARYHAFSDGACPAVGCWWNVALPETLPMFGKLLLDHDGELWVEEFVPEYEDRLPRWWVLGRSGEFVARVELPPRFTPHGLGGGEVLGVMLDELDVNYVERRAIRR